MEVIKETIASYYGLGKMTGSSILFENEKNKWWMDLCFNLEKERGDSENYREDQFLGFTEGRSIFLLVGLAVPVK